MKYFTMSKDGKQEYQQFIKATNLTTNSKTYHPTIYDCAEFYGVDKNRISLICYGAKCRKTLVDSDGDRITFNYELIHIKEYENEDKIKRLPVHIIIKIHNEMSLLNYMLKKTKNQKYRKAMADRNRLLRKFNIETYRAKMFL